MKIITCGNYTNDIRSLDQTTKDPKFEETIKKEKYVRNVKIIQKIHRAAMCVRRK